MEEFKVTTKNKITLGMSVDEEKNQRLSSGTF